MLRSKSNSYKRKRQEINDMTAELQLLKRTEELLKEQVEQIKGRMVRHRVPNGSNIALITIRMNAFQTVPTGRELQIHIFVDPDPDPITVKSLDPDPNPDPEKLNS